MAGGAESGSAAGSGSVADAGSAADAYRAALSRHAIEDVQPVYRRLLRHLRERDTVVYEQAVDRYRSDVVEGAADEDPLLQWVRYGTWLAAQVARGRLVAVDRHGRAREPDGPPPLGPLLLHLPEDQGERALPIAVPADPSEAQEATRQLLCG